MSSSVHFKFKSQKEPSRVTFDGTGISVFELKREIINQSRLGDGSDFELSIYNEDTGEGESCELSDYPAFVSPCLLFTKEFGFGWTSKLEPITESRGRKQTE